MYSTHFSDLSFLYFSSFTINIQTLKKKQNVAGTCVWHATIGLAFLDLSLGYWNDYPD